MDTASVEVYAFPRKTLWQSAGIARVMREGRYQPVAPQGFTFEMFERYDGKLSTTVLTGESERPLTYPVLRFEQ